MGGNHCVPNTPVLRLLIGTNCIKRDQHRTSTSWPGRCTVVTTDRGLRPGPVDKTPVPRGLVAYYQHLRASRTGAERMATQFLAGSEAPLPDGLNSS